MKLATLVLNVLLMLAAVPGYGESMAMIDEGVPSVRIVDLDTGETLLQRKLPGVPEEILASADPARLVLHFQGPGRHNTWGNWFPTGLSSVLLLDSRTLDPVGTADLGWGRSQLLFRGGSLIALSPGFDSKKPADAKPSTLTAVDLESGKVVATQEHARYAESFGIGADGESLVVFHPSTERDRKNPSGLLRFVSPSTLEDQKSIQLKGTPTAPVSFEGSDELYVLRKLDRKTTVMDVVSMSARKVASTLDLPRDPRILGADPDTGRLFVAGGAGKETSLLTITGSSIQQTVRIGDRSSLMILDETGKRAFIAGTITFSVVDLSSSKSTVTERIFGKYEEIHEPIALVEAPELGRVIALYRSEATGKAFIFDGGTGAKIADLKTGSAWERWGKVIDAALSTASSYEAARRSAEADGGGTFFYTVYTPKSERSATRPVVFDGEQKRVFLLDDATSDITVMDMKTGERLTDVDVGAAPQQLRALGDGRLLVISERSLMLLDPSSSKTVTVARLDSPVDQIRELDGRILVATSTGLVVIDGEDGEIATAIYDVEKLGTLTILD